MAIKKKVCPFLWIKLQQQSMQTQDKKKETAENSIWTEKNKIYDNNNWKRETRANKRKSKGKNIE